MVTIADDSAGRTPLQNACPAPTTGATKVRTVPCTYNRFLRLSNLDAPRRTEDKVRSAVRMPPCQRSLSTRSPPSGCRTACARRLTTERGGPYILSDFRQEGTVCWAVRQDLNCMALQRARNRPCAAAEALLSGGSASRLTSEDAMTDWAESAEAHRDVLRARCHVRL